VLAAVEPKLGGEELQDNANEEVIGGEQRLVTANDEVLGGSLSTFTAIQVIVGGKRRRITAVDRPSPANRRLEPSPMPRPKSVLSAETRQALGLNQQELADLVGSSLRSVQRWETRGGAPHPSHLQAMADAVRPHDPELAAEIDAWAPRPAPVVTTGAPAVRPAPSPPAVPMPVLIDSVVCAAAEAMSLAPQALRPALRAALLRAKEAGLTMEAVIEGLAPAAMGKDAAR
jgi:hypothetical protein